MSTRFHEVELSESDRNPLRGKRMNLRTIGDAFSTAPYIVKYHDMNREMLIARLTEVQQIVEQLLAQVQASEHDAFAAHLYRSRREFRFACERAGKSGKAIERCVISTFRVAESMGFKGDFRQWEGLLRIGE